MVVVVVVVVVVAGEEAEAEETAKKYVSLYRPGKANSRALLVRF